MWSLWFSPQSDPLCPFRETLSDVRNSNGACTHGIAVLSRCAVSQGMAGGTSATTAALIVSVARNHTRHWSITAGRAVKRSRPCRLHSARTLLPIPSSLMQAALPRRLHTCAPVTVRTNPRWSPQCKSSRLKFFSEFDILGRHSFVLVPQNAHCNRDNPMTFTINLDYFCKSLDDKPISLG